ncbi:unnamed protein product [Periconia digitata]|uniref:Amidohydrolase-related domain-containing protein n=1 Tax=Periconia digitata TaxID=1303443 RepID=A0A9W4XJK3_9PLEO|nr:unnamed protein product [Periconia digitata]
MSTVTTPQAPLIACSEFYLSNIPQLSIAPSSPSLNMIAPHTVTKLKNTGPARLRDMRAAGISMQVISHVPILANPATCSKLNDALHTAVCTAPDRFAALALLSADDPREAARELQRCVTRFRFVGAVLGLSRGIDGVVFEELWAQAERYGVPIVLREVWPTKEQAQQYRTESLAAALQGPILTHLHAAHSSSPLPVVHLYATGVFDRHPNLRFVLSRTGITMCSLLPRIQALFTSFKDVQSLAHVFKPNRSFIDVWRHNFYIVAEDAMDNISMKALLTHMPVDRVLYGTGYPFEDKGRAVMSEMKDSGVLDQEEWEKVAWGNAERLFGLRGARGGDKRGGSRSSY